MSTIGPTITFKGSLTGEEDILIDGNLDGKIVIQGRGVTIGKKGQVKADINAKVIIVEGTVEGNLYGEEQLIVHQSGIVRSDIIAPRVALEDGSNVKGNVDMNPQEKPTETAISNKPRVGMKTT
jgi:cytoskeletal protein CcmA (bactofilin family)